MRGYVQNNGPAPKFVAQRGFPHGGKVDFDLLHLTYAKKSGIDELEQDFVQWLKDNIFTEDFWSFHNFDESGFVFAAPVAETAEKPAPKKRAAKKKAARKKVVAEEAPKKKDPGKGAGKKMTRSSNEPVKGSVITPSTIIEAEYGLAKPLIEKCRDREVLKKALTLSRHFSSKEQHMRHLMRRLDQVY